jgi:hypothetical protein
VFTPLFFVMARRPITKGLNDKAMAISGQQDCIVPLAAGHLSDCSMSRALLAQCSVSPVTVENDALTGA